VPKCTGHFGTGAEVSYEHFGTGSKCRGSEVSVLHLYALEKIGWQDLVGT